jgi:tRNA threonylcarbamoyladenosine biosynthesis protein TsaE
MITAENSVFIATEAAMVSAGKRLGAAVQQVGQGGVIFLQGDLGTGKTTLCRGILRHFGVQSAVKSPTYTLVEPYRLASQVVNHFDLYRLGHPEELEYLGIRDYFSSHCLNLIEWPDKGYGILPPADLVVSISLNGCGRWILLQTVSPLGLEILRSWY